MENDTLFETTAIIDIDERIRKEEELMNTIKMEPILERTIIQEEPLISKQRTKTKVTDYILMALIFILSAVFIYVLIKLR